MPIVAETLAPLKKQDGTIMKTVIKILTMIIMVATTLRAVLQAVEALGSLPVTEVLIELTKLLAALDWF